MGEPFPSPKALEWVERWRRDHAPGVSVATDPIRAVLLESVREAVQEAIDEGFTYEEFAEITRAAFNG